MASSPLPRVQRLSVEPLDLRLHAPFGIAGGVQAVAANVLVTLELDDGTVGLGEAAPLPAYNGETQAVALAVLQTARSWLPGWPAGDWRALAAEFRRRGGATSGSAQAGFELALLDALTRRDERSLTAFFGGAGEEIETDMTITTGSVAEAQAAVADIRRRGIRMIKVKVGGRGGPAHDLARVRAVAEAAPEAPLILDGNASLTREQARELARGLQAAGVVPAMAEQWLAKDDLAGLHALGKETGWTIVADESVVTPLDALRVAHAGAAEVVNIKLMKAGVLAAWDIVEVARRAGLRLMIGGNVESILGMTASTCFATGLGGFCHADLDTPFFLAENPFAGGFALQAGGRLSVAQVRLGHGVVRKAHEATASSRPAAPA